MEARRKLGTNRGLGYGVIQPPPGQTDAYPEGTVPRRATSLRDDHGPRAVMNAVERLADEYEEECAATRAEIGVKEGQLRDFEARVGREFEHEAYRRQLSDLRNRLKLGLSDRAGEEDKRGVPGLAEQIKEMKAANAVEGIPERATRRAARAERPVTARIRKPKQPDEPIAEAKPGPPPESPPIIRMPEPKPTYREKAARPGKQMTMW